MNKKVYIKPQTDIYEYSMGVQLLMMSELVPLGNDWLGQSSTESCRDIGRC